MAPVEEDFHLKLLFFISFGTVLEEDYLPVASITGTVTLKHQRIPPVSELRLLNKVPSIVSDRLFAVLVRCGQIGILHYFFLNLTGLIQLEIGSVFKYEREFTKLHRFFVLLTSL